MPLVAAFAAQTLDAWRDEIKSGRLSAWGTMEYGPKRNELALVEARLNGADVTYVKSTAEQASLSDAATEGAAKVTQQPAAEVRADRIVIDRSTLGYRDETVDPPYRVFIADTHAEVHDFTNVVDGKGSRPGKAAVRGAFMETRSMPDEKVPPAPVRIAARTSSLSST